MSAKPDRPDLDFLVTPCQAFNSVPGDTSLIHNIETGREALDDPEALRSWTHDWLVVHDAVVHLHRKPERHLAQVRAWMADVQEQLDAPEVEEAVARVADALSAHGTLDRDLFLDCLD